MLICENPDTASLMHQAMSLRGKAAPGPQLEALNAGLAELYGLFLALLKQGLADGSIRPAVEAEKAAFAFFFLMLGALGLTAESAGRPALRVPNRGVWDYYESR